MRIKPKAQGEAPGVPNRYPQMVPGLFYGNRFGYGNYGASQRKIANEFWKAASGSADDDILFNLPLLRVRSRDLFMGSPIASAAVLTLSDNVIGDGLVPIPQVDGEYLDMDSQEAEEINDEIKNEFNLFANTVECDWNRRNTFYELTRLAFINMMISGDVLGLLPLKERIGAVYDTKIRLLEADRVASPDQIYGYNGDREDRDRVFGGVELTLDGEVEAYWIAPRHPMVTGGGFLPPIDPDEYVRIPAFGEETGRPVALLVAEMERPEQRRGVPFMSKCLTELKQMQRYIESTTVQNVIKSYFTAFIESQMPSSEMFDRLIEDEDLGDWINYNPYEVRLGPGIVNWMRPGDKITFPVNSGPDPQFDSYVTSMCKFIGACLGIPFEILLKHFASSYSASRAAKLEFWNRVKVLRRLVANQWCQPIYVNWMMEAVARGAWNAPGFFEDPRIFQAWTKCMWTGSSPGSIDPLREITASERKVKLGVSTLEQECLEINGSSWKANTEQQHNEVAFSTSLGLTYIRNLDDRGQPIQNLGVSELLLEDDEDDSISQSNSPIEG